MDRNEIILFLQSKLEDIGLDTQLHDLGTSTGANLWCLLRSPRADGTTAMVITARYPDHLMTEGGNSGSDAARALHSTAFLVSFLDYLSTTHWLSKDVIAVFTPSSAPQHSALDSWLASYHGASSGTPGMQRADIWTALCIDLPPAAFSTLLIGIEGPNGQLPNLDLVNAAVSSAGSMHFRVLVTPPDGPWPAVRERLLALLGPAAAAWARPALAPLECILSQSFAV